MLVTVNSNTSILALLVASATVSQLFIEAFTVSSVTSSKSIRLTVRTSLKASRLDFPLGATPASSMYETDGQNTKVALQNDDTDINNGDVHPFFAEKQTAKLKSPSSDDIDTHVTEGLDHAFDEKSDAATTTLTNESTIYNRPEHKAPDESIVLDQKQLEDQLFNDKIIEFSRIVEARRQPKSLQEEAELSAKYGAIEDIRQRSFVILSDLGMVDQSFEARRQPKSEHKEAELATKYSSLTDVGTRSYTILSDLGMA